MHRFLVSFPLTDSLCLTKEHHLDLFHQLMHVFRVKIGSQFAFFHAREDDNVYEVIKIEKKSIFFLKKDVIPTHDTLSSFVLFQAYPHKISTMEFIVQKAVEIGIQKVVFFASQYSQIQILPTQKKERLISIGHEALEQSGGNMPLAIEYYSDVQTAYDTYASFYHIVGTPEQNNQTLSISTPTALWIGPEGGWSKEEEHFFYQHEFTFWSFGKRIMRLETAAIVGIGILLYSGR